ncbi:DedA family protein [Paenochrobactrum sp. BZR 588]|uniref:DedA family protein n=1 Tax=Paenochrobactrum TaxID=999488 RepID=UPI0035BC3EE3
MEYIEPYLASYGALALFIIIYFESFGVPVPGESALIAASLLALKGNLSLSAILIACFAGAVLGDCTGYLIGHFGGRKLLQRFGSNIKLTPERLANFEKQFEKRGIYMVATARFIVIMRQLNGIIAGSMHMRFSHFLSANIIGALGWTAVWGAGPYLFGGTLAPVAAYIKSLWS